MKDGGGGGDAVSLASSKHSKGTLSTKASTFASSKKSKGSKSSTTLSTMHEKKNKKSKTKTKATNKTKKEEDSKGTKKKKSSKKSSSGKTKTETIFADPPKEVIEYLDVLFRSAFMGHCDPAILQHVHLVNIKLCFKDASTNKKHVISTSSTKKKKKKSIKTKGEKATKMKDKTKSKKSSSSTKDTKKKSKKKSSTGDEDPSVVEDDKVELPSSFFDLDVTAIAEMVATPKKEGSSKQRRRAKKGTSESLRNKSSKTSTSSDHDQFLHDMASMTHSSSESTSTPVVTNATAILVEPTVSSILETREDADTIEPPSDRLDLFDNVQDEDFGNGVDEDKAEKKKSKKKKSKLNMVIKKTKKTIGKALGGGSKKPKKGKKKEKKKKVKWTPLPSDQVPLGSAMDEEYDEEEELQWATQDLTSPPGRRKKVSKAWGGEEREFSETSEYAMSVVSGVGAPAVESSSSADENSMYTDGGPERSRVLGQRDYISNNGIQYESSDEGSTVEEIEIDEDSYYTEESWDEEEEYVSSDEEDSVSREQGQNDDDDAYISPDEDEGYESPKDEGPFVYRDASEYISPMQSPAPGSHAAFEEARIREMMKSKLSAPSSFYEDIENDSSSSSS